MIDVMGRLVEWFCRHNLCIEELEVTLTFPTLEARRRFDHTLARDELGPMSYRSGTIIPRDDLEIFGVPLHRVVKGEKHEYLKEWPL